MSKFNRRQLREWAITGAGQRLLEIAREAEAIHRAFPELRERGAGPGKARKTTGAGGARTGGGRRKLSAAARKRISDAQKKRWAAHRRGAR